MDPRMEIEAGSATLGIQSGIGSAIPAFLDGLAAFLGRAGGLAGRSRQVLAAGAGRSPWLRATRPTPIR